MTVINKLFLYIIAHYVGDYVITSRWIHDSKGKYFYHLFIHCLLYTFSFYLAILLNNQIISGALSMDMFDWISLSIIFFTHIVIDKAKCVLRIKYISKEMLWYALDQALHFIVIFGILFI